MAGGHAVHRDGDHVRRQHDQHVVPEKQSSINKVVNFSHDSELTGRVLWVPDNVTLDNVTFWIM